MLNEGREVEAWYREWLDSGWGPARVAKAVEQKYGPDEVRAIYTALGNRIHLEKQPLGRDLYVAALAEAGLPAELADAADSTDLDDALLAGNRAGLGPVGEDLGTPAIHVTMPDGEVNAFFGPVVSPVPRGEAAGRLWDGVLLVSGTAGVLRAEAGPHPPGGQLTSISITAGARRASGPARRRTRPACGPARRGRRTTRAYAAKSGLTRSVPYSRPGNRRAGGRGSCRRSRC